MGHGKGKGECRADMGEWGGEELQEASKGHGISRKQALGRRYGELPAPFASLLTKDLLAEVANIWPPPVDFPISFWGAGIQSGPFFWVRLIYLGFFSGKELGDKCDKWPSCSGSCCCRLPLFQEILHPHKYTGKREFPSFGAAWKHQRILLLDTEGAQTSHFAFPNIWRVKTSWKARKGIFCLLVCNHSARRPATVGHGEGGGENKEVISLGAVCHSSCAWLLFLPVGGNDDLFLLSRTRCSSSYFTLPFECYRVVL